MWCNNVERGCGWEGTVRTLEDHVTKCGFNLVPCPNGCKGEDEMTLQLLKKNWDSHLECCPEREHQCLDCGLKDAYRVIVGPHDMECTKKMVVCPNEECCVSLERSMVQEHVQQTCDYTVWNCRYASIGCKAQVVHKDLERHENNMEHHFRMALDRISELMEKISSPPPLPPPPPPPPQSKKKMEHTITFRLCGYYDKKRTNSCHYFMPFCTSPLGYTLNLYLYANGQYSGKNSHVSVYIKVLDGVFDMRLEWPLKGSFTIELLNQLADSNHFSHTLTFTEDDLCQPGSSGWGYPKFIKQSRLSHDSAKNMQYLKDDVLFLRVTSNPTNHRPWLDFTHE